MKRANKVGVSAAEPVERRASAERSLGGHAVAGTQRPAESDDGLTRVREAARWNRSLRFNNVLHHVSHPLLEQAYGALRKEAAPGVDGVDWEEYGEGLAERLVRLHEAVQSGRSQHDALDAWYMAITTRKVSWVLDADIEACFDRIEHHKLLAVLGRRIADRRVLRLIEQTLVAGVVADGKWQPNRVGVPQGAVISPLLANVFLHDAIDRWVKGWRERGARGMVSIVRYADDFVIGVQYRDDGVRLRKRLEERLARYGLTLHPSKTRLLEFGRFAAANRAQRGAGKPESFDFLGFTHCCAVRRSNGAFALRRLSIAKRVRAFLQRIKHELKLRYAWSIARQGGHQRGHPDTNGDIHQRGHPRFRLFPTPRRDDFLQTPAS